MVHGQPRAQLEVAPATVEEFAVRGRRWLEENAASAGDSRGLAAWGDGTDDVSVFRETSDEREASLLNEAMRWQQRKFDAGFGAITWPTELGGAGLTEGHELAFKEQEQGFDVPAQPDLFSVTLDLIAPTVRTYGTAGQKQRWIPRFLRTSELCCQLFSEPGAGSDLAGLSTKAVRAGDGWVITGQKVWSSGARFAQWGEIICRSDPSVPKHAGMTAFIIPMNLPGLTIVPIRQMTGGASFNEVFLDDVLVCDSARLGKEGAGWKVALTTLGFERGNASSAGWTSSVGGSWERLLGLARWLGVSDDPVVRQRLADLYSLRELRRFNSLRRQAARTHHGGRDPRARSRSSFGPGG